MLVLQSGSVQCGVTTVFTPEELTLLDHYATEAERLAATAALQRVPRSMALCLTDGGAKVVFKPELTDDEVSALLHRLRPFILESEPYSFLKVRKLVARRVDDAVIRAVLEEELQRYDSSDWQKELRVSSGEHVLNSEAMLKLWLNSREYHRDRDKQETLQQVLETSVPGLHYWAAVKMLIHKAQSVLRVATLLRVILDRQADIDFTIETRRYTLRNEQPAHDAQGCQR